MHIHEDLEYWGINGNLMDACCLLKHYPELKDSQDESKRDQKCKEKEARKALEENFGASYLARYRKFLWCLTEYPERSKAARVRNSMEFFELFYCNVRGLF